MLQLAPLAVGQQLPAVVERQTVLRGLLGNMQLQQHVDDPPALGGLLVNLLQQLQRVDGLHHIYIRCYILHLVRLQVTDEVPDDVLRQRLVLHLQLLLVALAEHPLALLVSGLDVFIGVILADGHQPDTLGQRVEHTVQVSLNVVHLTARIQVSRPSACPCRIRRRP